jgi:hypothetical protein
MAGNAILACRARDVGLRSTLGSGQLAPKPNGFQGCTRPMSAAYGTGDDSDAVAIAGQEIALSRSPPAGSRGSRRREHRRIAERRHPASTADEMASSWRDDCGALPGVLPRLSYRSLPYLVAAFNRKVRREYQF